jgi:frataxin-like iron-binding protein CyaY
MIEIKEEPNHEMWTVCPDCGNEYDLRQGDCDCKR